MTANSSTEIPVLIVGGGASGTMLALQLSRYGVPSRTIDKLPGPAETSRAITVHSRMLEIFECIDRKLVQRYLDRGIKNKGYVLHYVKRGERSEVRPGIDFTTLECKYPFLLVHRQDETEKFLREYWHEKYDGAVEWNTKLTDIKQDADGVSSTVVHTDRNNEVEIINSKYVIACDGINSQVRSSLKLEQDESDYKGSVMQNLDIRIPNFPDADDYVHYCAGTDHFMMVVRLPGDYYRLLISDRGEAADPRFTPEQAFLNILNQHFDGIQFGERIWHSKWESWVRLVKNYREGNVFLVGDSAHVHSTTGGQGMNCCIQDAYNLGWKLGMVENRLLNPNALDSYAAERRPIAEQVIWAASSLHDIFMGHGKDIGQRSEQIKDQEYLRKVVGCCSGISYTYKDYVTPYPQLCHLSGPQIGDRAPDVEINENLNLFELIGHTKFTLLLCNTRNDDLVEHVNSKFGDSIMCHTITHSVKFNECYKTENDQRLYLIRPDGYIGFRCLISEQDHLFTFLEHNFKKSND